MLSWEALSQWSLSPAQTIDRFLLRAIQDHHWVPSQLFPSLATSRTSCYRCHISSQPSVLSQFYFGPELQNAPPPHGPFPLILLSSVIHWPQNSHIAAVYMADFKLRPPQYEEWQGDVGQSGDYCMSWYSLTPCSGHSFPSVWVYFPLSSSLCL